MSQFYAKGILQPKDYKNLQEMFDDLIEKALLETNIKNQEKIYFDIQKLAIDWAVDIFQAELLGRHYEQPWLAGWYNNPAYPGEWFYALSKTEPTILKVKSPTSGKVQWIHKTGSQISICNPGPQPISRAGGEHPRPFSFPLPRALAELRILC
jgi:hypothetical protein